MFFVEHVGTYYSFNLIQVVITSFGISESCSSKKEHTYTDRPFPVTT